LQALLGRAFSAAALGEWMLLLASLLLAGLVSAVLSRARENRPFSVLFGRRLIDGALLPLLAVGFALAARRLLPVFGLSPALFRLVLP
uniref:hypothetical protein n=1 Tax=Escherichia coli TaxID=562 RepID=UPI0019532478